MTTRCTSRVGVGVTVFATLYVLVCVVFMSKQNCCQTTERESVRLERDALPWKVVTVAQEQRDENVAVLDACEGSIDFVVSWANGSDPARLATIQQYWREMHEGEEVPLNRWREYGSLYFSLLSIHKFAAPWAGTIHVFTSDNQVPSFMASGQRPVFYNKVVLVNDDVVWANSSLLPSFNSHAFELNLHRIPNLRECFIYLCDDFFLGRHARPTDFFRFRDGLVRPIARLDQGGISYSAYKRSLDQPQEIQRDDVNNEVLPGRLAVLRRMRKARQFLKVTDSPGWVKSFGRSWMLLEAKGELAPSPRFDPTGFPRSILSHTGRPMLKSQARRVVEMFPEAVHGTLSARFRSDLDVSMFGLYYWWRDSRAEFLHYGQHHRATLFMMMGFGKQTVDKFDEDMGKTFLSQDYLWICINDDLPNNDASLPLFVDHFKAGMSLLFCHNITEFSNSLHPSTSMLFAKHSTRCF
eukprot:TRINITY_DN20168_c0_g1_i1.p1 TRINITY_DN20168_c0_g1~~TRINITY_DN20168_c0_g1_i1.p1  ORF type:complete len:482 (-),score=58.79 TRINITY_DN20168_c0_g1_i1:272-1672(-)